MTKSEELYTGQAGADYWQRNKDRLEKEREERGRALRSLTIVDGVIDSNAIWLEVGGGQGHNLYAYDVCLDIDPRQLAVAKSRVLTPVLGHAYNLSMFPDGAFEVVLSVGCLMHLPDCEYTDEKGFVYHADFGPCPSWQKAVSEMARASARYIILGEYMAEQEEPIIDKHWPEGTLWRRKYNVPGMQLIRTEHPLKPFDSDVTFQVWSK